MDNRIQKGDIVNKKLKPIEINNLRLLATRYMEKGVATEEIKKDDITDLFRAELPLMIKHGELINIGIIGEVTLGKSTLGMALLWEDILPALKNKREPPRICADQSEFLTVIFTENPQNTAMQIDEFNRLAQTGYNATTVEAELETYSQIFAQDYVHRVSCSPDKLVDKGANIILNVTGADKEGKETVAKVSYRLTEPGQEVIQLIGHIRIFVGNVLRQPWYKKYRKRKFLKMEMIREKGIKDPQMVRYAEIVMEAYENKKHVARLGNLSLDQIEATINRIATKRVMYLSILTQQWLARSVNSLLKEERNIRRYQKMLLGAKAQLRKGNTTKEEINEIKKALKQEQEGLAEDLNTYQEMMKIQKKFTDLGKTKQINTTKTNNNKRKKTAGDVKQNG